MRQWVRLCSVSEAPATGMVVEADAQGTTICVANVDGQLCAIDNVCPHREGPLGQGWLEGTAVVCPWHSWTFDLKTGHAEYPAGEEVAVYPVRVEGDDVFVEMAEQASL